MPVRKLIATTSFSCNVGSESEPEEFVAEAGKTTVPETHPAVLIAPRFWEPAPPRNRNRS